MIVNRAFQLYCFVTLIFFSALFRQQNRESTQTLYVSLLTDLSILFIFVYDSTIAPQFQRNCSCVVVHHIIIVVFIVVIVAVDGGFRFVAYLPHSCDTVIQLWHTWKCSAIVRTPHTEIRSLYVIQCIHAI